VQGERKRKFICSLPNRSLYSPSVAQVNIVQGETYFQFPEAQPIFTKRSAGKDSESFLF
jgi:hypothetical protein